MNHVNVRHTDFEEYYYHCIPMNTAVGNGMFIIMMNILQEIKTIQLEDALNERADDEMDVSDEEDNSCILRKRPRNNDTLEQERSNLKDENDSLRCQLEAYKNEVDLVRNDMKAEVENKDKQLKMLQHTLQGMQQQLIESRRKQSEEENKVSSILFLITI